MIRISHDTGILKGTIKLPSSKSISNRMLILKYLYEQDMELDNLSNANDTVLLESLLSNGGAELNVQDAGTAYRFLTAYCATQEGVWTIQGTDRLNERPIAVLVDALRQLGADITYLKEEGKAPLKIRGKKLIAANTLIDVTHVQSSQFISALLLIAPMVEGDFNLKVNKKMPSYSYVSLTVGCLRRMGYTVFLKGQYIQVNKQQRFDGEYFFVEPDWTSFYYWLSMAHLAKEVDLFFPGLRLDNMSKERKLLYDVGNTELKFEEVESGLKIVKNSIGAYDVKMELNFAQFPDSAMTFVMLIAALHKDGVIFKGLESLKYKECNREEAIALHLDKVQADFIKKEATWRLSATDFGLKKDTLFESYDDHRMAMCAAPLALVNTIVIEDETVVRKSYPHFWEDMKSVGFEIEYL